MWQVFNKYIHTNVGIEYTIDLAGSPAFFSYGHLVMCVVFDALASVPLCSPRGTVFGHVQRLVEHILQVGARKESIKYRLGTFVALPPAWLVEPSLMLR